MALRAAEFLTPWPNVHDHAVLSVAGPERTAWSWTGC